MILCSELESFNESVIFCRSEKPGEKSMYSPKKESQDETYISPTKNPKVSCWLCYNFSVSKSQHKNILIYTVTIIIMPKSISNYPTLKKILYGFYLNEDGRPGIEREDPVSNAYSQGNLSVWKLKI